MDEVWARIGLVVAALAIAGLVIAFQRRRQRIPERDLVASQLTPGLHFFASRGCSTCEGAREKIVSTVGENGYVEHVWEEDPGVFSELGVDAVPAVLVVREGGRARLYPGRPDKALANR